MLSISCKLSSKAWTKITLSIGFGRMLKIMSRRSRGLKSGWRICGIIRFLNSGFDHRFKISEKLFDPGVTKSFTEGVYFAFGKECNSRAIHCSLYQYTTNRWQI